MWGSVRYTTHPVPVMLHNKMHGTLPYTAHSCPDETSSAHVRMLHYTHILICALAHLQHNNFVHISEYKADTGLVVCVCVWGGPKHWALLFNSTPEAGPCAFRSTKSPPQGTPAEPHPKAGAATHHSSIPGPGAELASRPCHQPPLQPLSPQPVA